MIPEPDGIGFWDQKKGERMHVERFNLTAISLGHSGA